jgi:hypothetical protein
VSPVSYFSLFEFHPIIYRNGVKIQTPPEKKLDKSGKKAEIITTLSPEIGFRIER